MTEKVDGRAINNGGYFDEFISTVFTLTTVSLIG